MRRRASRPGPTRQTDSRSRSPGAGPLLPPGSRRRRADLAGDGCEGGGAAGAVVPRAVSVQPGSVTVVLGNGGSAVDRLRREALTYVADDLANDGAAGEEDAGLGAAVFAAGAGRGAGAGGEEGAAVGAECVAAGAGADLLVGEHGEEDNLGFVAGVDVTRFRAWYP